MDISIIEGLINSVGFPIAVCAALFWNAKETRAHYEKMLLEYSTTIEKNTEAINRMIARIERG